MLPPTSRRWGRRGAACGIREDRFRSLRGIAMRVSAWGHLSVLRRWRRSAVWNGLAVGALAAPLLLSAAARSAPLVSAAPGLPPVDLGQPVAVQPFTPHPAAANAAPAVNAVPTAVHWPAAASGSAALSAPGAAGSDLARPAAQVARPAAGTLGTVAKAPGTPVSFRSVAPVTGSYQG